MDKFAPLPGFIIGWKVPARRSTDSYALALAFDLLTEGDSSRLYQKLVKEEESVVQIQGGVDERRGPSAAFIFALPKPGNDGDSVRKTIFSEIRRLAEEGPSEDEMVKLRNGLLNDSVRGRQSSLFRAQRLAEYALYDNDPTIMNSELEKYLEVTAQQVQEAVSRYLVTDNYSALDILPASAEGLEPLAGDFEEPEFDEGQPGAPPPQLPDDLTEKTDVVTGSLPELGLVEEPKLN